MTAFLARLGNERAARAAPGHISDVAIEARRRILPGSNDCAEPTAPMEGKPKTIETGIRLPATLCNSRAYLTDAEPMVDAADSTPIGFICEACRREMSRSKQWLASNERFHCDGCGAIVDGAVTKLARAIREARKAMDRLKGAFEP